MKPYFLELLNRFAAFVKILFSPRRSFAFRMLERENTELKERFVQRETELKEIIALREKEIQQLHELNRLANRNPLLSDLEPRQTGKSIVQPARRSRRDIELKYQKRFKDRANILRNQQEKKAQQAQQAGPTTGYPNDYKQEAVS